MENKIIKKAQIPFLFVFFLLFGLKSYAQPHAASSNLKGKRIAVIGDSYVKNHTKSFELTWHYKWAKKHEMQYFNYGINGNSIAYSSSQWGEALYLRYQKMEDALDYIVVIAGHNDCSKLEAIGGIEIFKERMDSLCKGLIEKYPSAKIFFFTRWNCIDFNGSNAEKVIDTMIQVCGNYSIPIFDCARKSGIHAHSDTFRKIYFQNQGIKDNAHLNAKGHDRFLPIAEKFILCY